MKFSPRTLLKLKSKNKKLRPRKYKRLKRETKIFCENKRIPDKGRGVRKFGTTLVRITYEL